MLKVPTCSSNSSSKKFLVGAMGNAPGRARNRRGVFRCTMHPLHISFDRAVRWVINVAATLPEHWTRVGIFINCIFLSLFQKLAKIYYNRSTFAKNGQTRKIRDLQVPTWHHHHHQRERYRRIFLPNAPPVNPAHTTRARYLGTLRKSVRNDVLSGRRVVCGTAR